MLWWSMSIFRPAVSSAMKSPFTRGVQQTNGSRHRCGSYPVVTETRVLVQGLYRTLAQINLMPSSKEFRFGYKRGFRKNHDLIDGT